MELWRNENRYYVNGKEVVSVLMRGLGLAGNGMGVDVERNGEGRELT